MLQVHLVEWLEVPKMMKINFKLNKLIQELSHQSKLNTRTRYDK